MREPDGASGPREMSGPDGASGPREMSGPDGASGPRRMSGPDGASGQRQMSGPDGARGQRRMTERLRLEPAGPGNARDLALVLTDDAVWPWYGRTKPTADQVDRTAHAMGESWRLHGVHKWIAYDRGTGEVVGRGGLSRTPVDDDWAQLYAFLPAEPWTRAEHPVRRPFAAHAAWVEVGWAVRGAFHGRGYATEIGRASLAYAFEVLDVRAVVSCTVRHNVRSRAVMERLGMHHAGEIRSPDPVTGPGTPFTVSASFRSRSPG
ncbi:GNAT family N-acetyltransferase [Paractinoplanes maris]|uniref:GNAT family N-acetyltransferase n=1 Tax=Paractinoplanes maris TaxID=1734446 RepID=UPI0020221787|nr:GNAT family N-acetyltransferase [Actinoplanes maris]